MLNVRRNHKAYYGRGQRGGKGGGIYIICYIVTTRMTPALRWAAVRANLNVLLIVSDKVTRQYPQTTTFLKRRESRSGIEPRSALLLTVRPNRLTLISSVVVQVLRLYVSRNRRFIRDGEPRTSTSTFTQLPSSVISSLSCLGYIVRR